MKRYVLSIALLATIVGAIQITATGGGNYQAMNPEYNWGDAGWGWGWHGSLLTELSIVPSLLGINIGIESGVLLQQANYSYIPAIPEDPPGVGHQLNLIAPFLIKLRLATEKPLHFQWGVGPSLIRNFYVWWESDAGEKGVVDKQDYETDLGLQIKGEVNIKLADRMWLNPTISRQFILTAKDTWLENSKHWFFSLGLALKL